METLINIISILLALFPLLMILLAGVINFIRKERFVEIIVKGAIAFCFYILGAIIAFILFVIAFSRGDPAPPIGETSPVNETSFEPRDIMVILIWIGYIGFGFFLGWFVKRDLGNTISLIVGKREKTLSLFRE